jgi:predicted outer membrane repeat protein
MTYLSLHGHLASYRSHFARPLTAAALVIAGLTNAHSAHAKTLMVPTQYATIQAAINAAAKGDTVVVAPGFYYSPGNVNIDTLGKAITVKSQAGPGTCTIAGSLTNRGFIIHKKETTATRIVGFTIEACYGSQGGAIAITNASPTITNCVFQHNATSGNGGGVFVANNSSPVISNCTFYSNNAGVNGSAGFGAGLYLWTGKSKVTNCVFDHNTATSWGGGLLAQADASTLTNCTFTNNTAQVGGGAIVTLGGKAAFNTCDFADNNAAYGGGMYAAGNATPIVNGNTFTDNTASGQGAGIFLAAGTLATLLNSEFQGNTASDVGGGLLIVGSNHTVNNCVFASNQAASGGGIYIDSAAPAITDCEFDFNVATSGGGGAVRVDSNTAIANPTFTNCLFTVNSGPSGGAILNYGATVTVGCVFYGNHAAADGGAEAVLGQQIIATNCIYQYNTATIGGGALSLSGSVAAHIVNCTFSQNASPQGDAIDCASGAGVYVDNCIVWDSQDTVAGNEFAIINGGFVAAAFSDVFGGGNNDTIINVDPMFVSAGGDNFMLQAGSPCIGKGTPNVAYYLNTDILGSPRNATAPSLGAYEN